MEWIEKVKGYLIGRTIVDVEEYETPSRVDEEMTGDEGIVLVLDDNSRVYVGIEEVDMTMIVRREG